MAGKMKSSQTVPSPFRDSGTAGRKPLKAGAAAIAALARLQAEAREVAELERQERRGAGREMETHLLTVERESLERGEEVKRAACGPLHVARDGLVWCRNKATIAPVHYDAGLRFRRDYETANGTGVSSCLADPGSHVAFNPHKAGATDAMLLARSEVKAALAALGTPILHGYVQLVAGEGAMLTDQRFSGPKGAGDHALPCRIAFDLLARHYGMIR